MTTFFRQAAASAWLPSSAFRLKRRLEEAAALEALEENERRAVHALRNEKLEK